MQHQSNGAPGREVQPDALKPGDVARLLKVDLSTVYRLLRANDIASYRVGTGRGTIRIPQASLRAYAEPRGIPLGGTPADVACRLSNCNGLLHDENVCSVDLAETSLGYLSLVSYPDTKVRDLNVYSDAHGTITDPTEARELAEQFRQFAVALDNSALLLDEGVWS